LLPPLVVVGVGVASLVNGRMSCGICSQGLEDPLLWSRKSSSPLALMPDVPSCLQASVLHALKNSYSFQFGIDTVNSLRCLLKLLNKMDDVTADSRRCDRRLQRWKIAYGLGPPTLDVIEKLRQPVNWDRSTEGTEHFDIAADFVVWTLDELKMALITKM